jgi:hypothetical protein
MRTLMRRHPIAIALALLGLVLLLIALFPARQQPPRFAGDGPSVEGLAIVGLILAVYFVPTMIASNQQHHNVTAIFFLNLFLGWSVLGWVGAFIWALAKPSTVIVPDERSRAPQPQLAENARRPCPFCAESIIASARVCRYCGKELPAAWSLPALPSGDEDSLGRLARSGYRMRVDPDGACERAGDKKSPR